MELLGIVRYEPKLSASLRAGREVQGPKDVYIPKYDLEAWRKNKWMIKEGDLVSITEKLHGCIPAHSSILMADGSRSTMRKVKIGDYVMGVDSAGNICASKVLNKFNNGPALNGWVNINGAKRRAGKGPATFSLNCTPEHKVWCVNKNQYIRADRLQIGDSLLTQRTDLGLSNIQKSVLLGMMIGDASITFNSLQTASIHWSHKKDHVEYNVWISQALGAITGNSKEYISGYGSEIQRQRTVSLPHIKELFGNFKNPNAPGKVIPQSIVDDIDPIALAFWYMDDGSLAHNEDQEDRAMFATCRYTEEDVDLLLRCFQKFNISAVKYFDSKFWRIRINADEADKLFILIAPYIPPVMQYKLPEYYRGGPGWLPKIGGVYKPNLIEVTISEIKFLPQNAFSSQRWDIETETSNYIANSILVHNCSARFLFHQDKFWVGSRNTWREQDDSNTYWKVANENPWIEQWCRNNPGCVLFGEIYGDVQDLKYGMKQGQADFAAFDVMYMGQYWTDKDFWEDQSITKKAPLLYSGPFNQEHMLTLVDGNTTIPNANNIMEGIVIKHNEDVFSRVALKFVSDEYLSRSKDG
jgi:hypothetical protein